LLTQGPPSIVECFIGVPPDKRAGRVGIPEIDDIGVGNVHDVSVIVQYFQNDIQPPAFGFIGNGQTVILGDIQVALGIFPHAIRSSKLTQGKSGIRQVGEYRR